MLNFITVVFRDEIDALKTQARSIKNYVTDVESITVVVNDSDDVAAAIDPSWWGDYPVIIKKLSDYGYTCRINGWENQQLLKLLAGSEASTEWSVVLDAKTWFIRPYTLDNIFDGKRVRSGILPVFKEFTDSQQFIEKYYNVSMPWTVGPGGVPFLFNTAIVKDLVASESDFVEFFQTHVRYPYLTTEFHVYSGFILSRYGSYEDFYSEDAYYLPMNIADFQVGEFDEKFAAIVNDPRIVTASIHRRAYPLLSADQLQSWNDFLVTKNLT